MTKNSKKQALALIAIAEINLADPVLLISTLALIKGIIVESDEC